MAIRRNIKKLFATITWIGIGLGLIVLLVAAIRKNNHAICKKIEIQLTGGGDRIFLPEKDILELIQADEILDHKKINEIDIKMLEKKLTGNIWIENVQLYFDKMANLHVLVKEREPIFRIISKGGNSFYMDHKHFQIPLSSTYSANVPIFTGFNDNKVFNSKDSSSLDCINTMALFIKKDAFWMAQIQQINLLPDDNFELVPTFGNHIIQFGDTSAMHEKFRKLFIFYKKVGTQAGFDKYIRLNLQFKNQVIATSNKTVQGIDTAKANQAIEHLIHAPLDSLADLPDSGTGNKTFPGKDTIQNVIAPTGKPGLVPRNPRSTTRPVNRNTPPVIKGNKPKALMPKKTTPPLRNKINHNKK